MISAIINQQASTNLGLYKGGKTGITCICSLSSLFSHFCLLCYLLFHHVIHWWLCGNQLCHCVHENACLILPQTKPQTITFNAHLYLGPTSADIAALLYYNTDSNRAFDASDVTSYFVVAHVSAAFINV